MGSESKDTLVPHHHSSALISKPSSIVPHTSIPDPPPAQYSAPCCA
jgi:hypothetical protein